MRKNLKFNEFEEEERKLNRDNQNTRAKIKRIDNFAKELYSITKDEIDFSKVTTVKTIFNQWCKRKLWIILFHKNWYNTIAEEKLDVIKEYPVKMYENFIFVFKLIFLNLFLLVGG